MELRRREFLKYWGMVAGASLIGMEGGVIMAKETSEVTLLETEDRKAGVKAILKAFKGNHWKEKKVLVNSQ
jgi:pyruvate/2-oxoglutarate dehydrogenase complex dihydrolipoamide dehydrogenase (E3) component